MAEQTLAIIYDFDEKHAEDREALRQVVRVLHGEKKDAESTPGQLGESAYLVRVDAEAKDLYDLVCEKILKRTPKGPEKLYVLEVGQIAGKGIFDVDLWIIGMSLKNLMDNLEG